KFLGPIRHSIPGLGASTSRLAAIIATLSVRTHSVSGPLTEVGGRVLSVSAPAPTIGKTRVRGRLMQCGSSASTVIVAGCSARRLHLVGQWSPDRMALRPLPTDRGNAASQLAAADKKAGKLSQACAAELAGGTPTERVTRVHTREPGILPKTMANLRSDTR